MASRVSTLRFLIILSAIFPITNSQSGGEMGVEVVIVELNSQLVIDVRECFQVETYFCEYMASKMSKALRRLRSDATAMR